MTTRNKKIIASFLLFVAGALFVFFGFTSLREMKDFTPVRAEVTRVEKEWVPDGENGDTEEIKIYVTYAYEGKEYTELLQNTTTNHSEGDIITVLCNPQDPTVVSGANKTVVMIQFAAGGLFALGGIVTFVLTLIKSR